MGVTNFQSTYDPRVWIEATRQVPNGESSQSDFLSWVNGPLRAFFPFERFFAGYGRLTASHIEVLRVSEIGHDPAFVGQIEKVFNQDSRGTFREWLQNQKAFLFDSNIPTSTASAREVDESMRFGLGLIAAHGIVDHMTMCGTYFSFSGVPRQSAAATLDSLNLITPVLHAFYLRTLHPDPNRLKDYQLSPRQRDIVLLLAAGQDDKAIAQELAISQETVGNHLRVIYDRFGIHKRGELIAFLRLRGFSGP
jgi:DNA-binding CsgD family transcriptional regulator